MDTRRKLLVLLTNGRFHSGNALGHQLGLSRAAVWKQIQTLQQEGLRIEAVKARGYRLLTPVELLEHELISAALPQKLRQRINLFVFDELDSTNRYLMEAGRMPESKRIPVCLVEKQRAGRGRHGRSWQTPYASAIAMSLRWRFEADAGSLAGLSLATGVVVTDVLERMGLSSLQLKWPNDVVAGDKKLGGILIEIAGDAAGPCDVVVGIGVNVCNSGTEQAVAMPRIEQPWTDVLTLLNGERLISRNQLAARLIEALIESFTVFGEQGFAPFQDHFNRRDALAGKKVCVLQAGGEKTGIACGVNGSGGLLLRSGNSTTTITSGEVSVRAAV